ncbi:MAG: MFS transporter [Archaeoglobaceae archaeon]
MLSSGLRSSKWVIFAILSSIYFFVYFHRTSPAVMANDLMLEFAVSALAIGVLSSLYFYPYAVLQIPVGVLSDVKGAKKVVVSFTSVTLFGILIFVTAPSFEFAVFSRLLIGIGVSGVYIPTVKIMSQWFKANEFATAMGILFAIGNFGAIFSSYPLAFSIENFGWRFSFAVIGAITALLLLLCIIFVKDAPSGFKKETPRREDFKLLFNLTLWLLAVSAMLRYGIVMGFQGLWGGPFLVDVLNLSKVLAGTVLMLFAIGAIIGAPLLGRISDEIGLRKLPMVLSGIGFTIFWLPLVLFPEKLGMIELSIISFMLGFFSSAGPIAYTLVKEQFPLRMTGVAISFINVFPFVGAGVFQTIMGYLMDSVGKLGDRYPVEAYRLSFEFCLVASIVSLILLLFVREKPRDIGDKNF